MSVVNRILDQLASQITVGITGSSTWVVEKYQPIVRNMHGPLLSIYAPSEGVGDFRSTGHTEIVTEIVIEYSEPAAQQVNTLIRDAAKEANLNDLAESFRNWALSHQAITDAYALNWTGTEQAPTGTEEGLFRLITTRFEARYTVTYS